MSHRNRPPWMFSDPRVDIFASQIFSVGVCMYHMLRPGGADFDIGPRPLGKGDVGTWRVFCFCLTFTQVQVSLENGR